MSLRLRHVRRHALVVVLSAGLLVVSLSGADAKVVTKSADESTSAVQQSDGRTASRKVTAGGLTPDEKKYGIPAVRLVDPLGGGNAQTPYGGPVSRVPVDIPKSKAQLTVPNSTLLGYIRTCLGQRFGPGVPEVQSCCPDPSTGLACNDDRVVQFPDTSVDAEGLAPWFRSDGPIWIKSPLGSRRQYGIFPAAKVQLLTFGALPATATLHLEQPVTANGQTTPLQFDQVLLTGPQEAGDGTQVNIPVKIDGFPQRQPAGVTSYLFWQRNSLSGPVNVRIDNVRVDGRLIDVGPSCRTTRPARLDFTAPRGWTPSLAPIRELYGSPGEFNPLGGIPANETGTAPTIVDVPAFTGCRDGRGSLDRLVTTLASGRGSARISLDAPILSCDQSPDEGRYRCPHYPGDPLLQSAGQAVAQSLGNAETVTASRVHRIARAAATLPARMRVALESSLPVATRAAVLRALR